MPIERQIGHQTLQLAVLITQLAKLAQLRKAQTAVLLLPDVLIDRIAYLDARPPQGSTLRVHGHSLARWQDGVLIVETSNFTENPIGITNGLPSSTEKHLVERFALAADGQSLVYSFELTDPVYLAAPLRGELRWLYRPNLRVELVPCDPEATRSFLDN